MAVKDETYRTTNHAGETVVGFRGYEVIIREDGTFRLLVLA